MNLKWFCIIAAITIGISIAGGTRLSCSASPGRDTHLALADLTSRAAIIKPSATELKWKLIPWVMDLTQGLKLAREEKRPIFLWVTGDDPLERC